MLEEGMQHEDGNFTKLRRVGCDRTDREVIRGKHGLKEAVCLSIVEQVSLREL